MALETVVERMLQLHAAVQEDARVEQLVQGQQHIARGAQGPYVGCAVLADGLQQRLRSALTLCEHLPLAISRCGQYVRRSGGRRSEGYRLNRFARGFQFLCEPCLLFLVVDVGIMVVYQREDQNV
jgi:hypothetical protein